MQGETAFFEKKAVSPCTLSAKKLTAPGKYDIMNIYLSVYR